MSATFGAPLAAVVLAIELLLFEFSARAFVPLVVATSSPAACTPRCSATGPLFRVPAHDYAGLEALPAFAILGLACGLLAVVISRGLFVVEDLYRKLPVKAFWHPVIGAVGFATVGLFVPRVLGVGLRRDRRRARRAGSPSARSPCSPSPSWWPGGSRSASGTSGGTLAPILLISARSACVVGSGLNTVLPGPDVAIGAFALVAMARRSAQRRGRRSPRSCSSSS